MPLGKRERADQIILTLSRRGARSLPGRVPRLLTGRFAHGSLRAVDDRGTRMSLSVRRTPPQSIRYG